MLVVLRNPNDDHNLAFTHTDEDGCYSLTAPPGQDRVRADVTGDQGFRDPDLTTTAPVTADFHINDTSVSMSIEVKDKQGRIFLGTQEYVTSPGGMPPDYVVGTLRGIGFFHKFIGRSVAKDGLGILWMTAIEGQYCLTIRARGFKTKTIQLTISGDGFRVDNSVVLAPRRSPQAVPEGEHVRQESF